eukprot:Plantae.Rhodophyta-Purpureofilum_apyrenoidigerum.ctg901.p1 GENE.Plantae.Rhodophyta-Purpureofilum_apyrenoidigerum.ctg901~~Plantae.Rhodophyta-Purpureofilum_apyrenoidigerum.ctg901.p1  ORF type:complete len:173 (-),score=25.99 Plantae.Rhodophyta-Purpureofilum_apyrenoidigerum.ctg901:50-568(-)
MVSSAKMRLETLLDPVPEKMVKKSFVMRTATGCESCGRCFALKASTLYHCHVDHGLKGVFTCEQCELAFKKRSSWNRHEKFVHQKIRPFSCPRCDAAFISNIDLSKHISSVHDKKRPFQCEVCGRSFGKKEHMTRHLRHVHHFQPKLSTSTVTVQAVNSQDMLRQTTQPYVL